VLFNKLNVVKSIINACKTQVFNQYHSTEAPRFGTLRALLEKLEEAVNDLEKEYKRDRGLIDTKEVPKHAKQKDNT
jgi:hypothetical protein